MTELKIGEISKPRFEFRTFGQDFDAVGGFDPDIQVMEEADFCLKIARSGRGRTRMINRHVWSSDRRVAAWGSLRANLTYIKVGVMWGLGAPQSALTKRYQDIR